MCGLAGFLVPPGSLERGDMLARLEPMTAALRERGPDDDGAWADADAGVALGFRRLAVLDLGPTGHQPMVSADGQHVLVFNGEIYNAEALRKRLEDEDAAPAWRGHSDTEVLLAALAAWGPEAALEGCDGMLAIAWWDAARQRLVLARDRFGEKPLYYGWIGTTLVFGSQLKALRPFEGFDTRLSATALSELLALGWIGGDRCIYAAIHKLPPGHLLVVDRAGEDAQHPSAGGRRVRRRSRP